MGYRDIHERHIYATKRAKSATERAARAANQADRDNARRWAEAWGAVARAHPSRRS